MTTFTQKKLLSALLLLAVADTYSKEAGKISAGEGELTMGTVLAKSAANAGELVQLVPGAGDSTGVAHCILGEDVDASGVDPVDAMTIKRAALLAEDEIVWPAGITDPQKATATDELEARGLVLRATI